MKDEDKTKVELIKELKTTQKERKKGVFKNITERKEAEEELKESEERYHTVFENTGTATMVVEEDMTISMVNTQCKKLCGYSKKKIENKMKWTDFIVPEDLEKVKKYHIARIARRKTGKEPPTEYEFRFIDRKGSIKDIFLKIGIIPNTKKSIASLTDITERKQVERALQEAHDQLEEKVAQRTKELEDANLKLQEIDHLKSMFIASMNHELRTPLNSIIGFTGVILQGMSGKINKEQRKQLTLVKKSANHLLALINDVIDISKIEAGKMKIAIEEFDLISLAQEVKNSFAVIAEEKGLQLLFQTPPTLLMKSDKRRTRQVMVNFISNALKFTDRGEIEVKIRKKDVSAEISVRDTGVGIKKEDMGKLFQAFNRIITNGRLTAGTGLGLYLSKKITDLLHGDIKVESEFGQGSVFTFTLPLKR